MKINHEFGAPKRSTIGSAGYDIITPFAITLIPGQFTNVSLQLQMEDGDIPEDCCMLILPRSSTGFKYGLRLANTIGLIDSDYRDNISASLTVEYDLLDKQFTNKDPNVDIINIEEDDMTILNYYVHFKAGDRILQGIVVPYMTIATEIAPTMTRNGGIGSTGR